MLTPKSHAMTVHEISQSPLLQQLEAHGLGAHGIAELFGENQELNYPAKGHSIRP